MSGLRVPVDGSSCQDLSHHYPTIPIQQQRCQHPPARRDRASARPYARGPDDLHAGPMTCTWALQPARVPDDMRVGNAAHMHI